MTRTTLEAFREELLRTGAYHTPADRKAPMLRKPGAWTTASFSWAPFSVFPKCAVWEALGRLDTEVWSHFCFECVRKAEAFGMDVTYEGWNNRRDYKGPVVYLANHMSTLETIVLPFTVLTYGPFGIFVKASLSHLPFLEKAAAHMGLIPLGRKSPRADLMQVFEKGCERLAAGASILIFPQGSRERVFSRKLYSSIGAKLAEKAGCPVVPIAVKTDCLPTRPKGVFKDFGPVDPTKDIRISCGPVLKGTAKEMHAASFDWIASKLESWSLPVERA